MKKGMTLLFISVLLLSCNNSSQTTYKDPDLATFENVLVIGNSITLHEIEEDVWWGRWGMAATKKENDFVSLLEKKLQTKTTRVNIAAWERKLNTSLSKLLKSCMSPDLDLVIIRLGENVSDIDNFADAFDELILYAIRKCPNAKILITGVFWTNLKTDMILSDIASKHGIGFVPLSDLYIDENIEKVGNLVNGDDFKQHPITNIDVARHPNDCGMKAISDRILNAINN